MAGPTLTASSAIRTCSLYIGVCVGGVGRRRENESGDKRQGPRGERERREMRKGEKGEERGRGGMERGERRKM